MTVGRDGRTWYRLGDVADLVGYTGGHDGAEIALSHRRFGPGC